MKAKVKNGRALLVGVLIGAVVASAVGVAYAAIPDSAGTIHACFQNVTSANKPLKLLDTGKSTACPSGWKPVSWNQKGQQGAPGSPGTPGTSGVSGYQVVQAISTGCGNCTAVYAEADCPAGKVPVGGGYSTPGASFSNTWSTGTDAPQYVKDGTGKVIGGGWLVQIYSTNSGFNFGPTFTLTVDVNCATMN